MAHIYGNNFKKFKKSWGQDLSSSSEFVQGDTVREDEDTTANRDPSSSIDENSTSASSTAANSTANDSPTANSASDYSAADNSTAVKKLVYEDYQPERAQF